MVEVTSFKKNTYAQPTRKKVSLSWVSLYSIEKRTVPHNPNWHEGYERYRKNLYTAIPIAIGQSWEFAPDIKTAWDYSRFLYAPTMQPCAFEKLVTDWLDANPSLYGINWLCPMEVAIRSINWIISFSRFNHHLSSDFQNKLIASLYDHMNYLEHNWELADGRTSNHYLSDLVGYLYLAWFFNDVKKQAWVVAEIEQEMAWQIFDEGTSYEGSTSYHQLVTELFVHADLMARECGFTFSDLFYEKLKKMQEFISWCNGVKIGDDDSGRITALNVLNWPHTSGLKTYKQFGLSIIKTKKWHITMRHPTYHPRQPTGHFHNDAGSITIAYDGIPIFADPGSYLYTPSQKWRDYFRSAAVHNKLYTKDTDDIVRESDMFTLNMRASENPGIAYKSSGSCFLESEYFLDSKSSLQASIKVECNTLRNEVAFFYRLKGASAQPVFLNFTGAPDIIIQKHQNDLVGWYRNKPLFMLVSNLDFQLYDAWVAPRYGTKVKTTGLRALIAQSDTLLRIRIPSLLNQGQPTSQ